jgi:hypothetical protein
VSQIETLIQTLAAVVIEADGKLAIAVTPREAGR